MVHKTVFVLVCLLAVWAEVLGVLVVYIPEVPREAPEVFHDAPTYSASKACLAHDHTLFGKLSKL